MTGACDIGAMARDGAWGLGQQQNRGLARGLEGGRQGLGAGGGRQGHAPW